MAKLITEISHEYTINEDKDKNLYITGIFSSAETKNNNGRSYSKQLLEREITNIDKKIKQKTCLGELNHPDSPNTNLERAAILIEALEWRGNDIYGKAKILSTPHGNIARNLIEDGVKLGISSRGLGTVKEDGTVDDSYQLLTYDLVSNPSNIGSWVNGIYEDKEFSSDKDYTDISEQQAKSIYTKHIWQVINEIKKKL